MHTYASTIGEQYTVNQLLVMLDRLPPSPPRSHGEMGDVDGEDVASILDELLAPSTAGET